MGSMAGILQQENSKIWSQKGKPAQVRKMLSTKPQWKTAFLLSTTCPRNGYFMQVISPGSANCLRFGALHVWFQLQLHAHPHPAATHFGSLNKGPLLAVFWTAVVPLIKRLGLPWWRGGWESACQCGGRGFEPWSGKIPRAAEQLGPWATIAEPARLEPVPRNGRGRDGERPAHRDEEWPPLAATRGSPRTETKTQHSQK